MPEIGIGKDFPVAPEGPGTFRLKEVELKTMKSFDGTEEIPRLIWKFVSRERSHEGDFYEVGIFTPPNYSGHPQSKLTWLMGRIDKRVTKEWVKQHGLHTDSYVDRDYEGIVEHKLSQDGSKTYATFVSLKPVGVAPAPADEKPDPFVTESSVESCETCGKALTGAEEAGCIKRWKGGHYFCAEHGRAQIQKERAEEADLFAAV